MFNSVWSSIDNWRFGILIIELTTTDNESVGIPLSDQASDSEFVTASERGSWDQQSQQEDCGFKTKCKEWTDNFSIKADKYVQLARKVDVGAIKTLNESFESQISTLLSFIYSVEQPIEIDDGISDDLIIIYNRKDEESHIICISSDNESDGGDNIIPPSDQASDSEFDSEDNI
ncbi:unnamed protein product [Mytilus edulis]|uniref:Uncharacterized protein n=1 Tax=Mytilus edulis TaxID=6550 RepID=A0A8S3TL84_MYTED|nr:unnamed protein product [Mytilus edulis]